MKNHLFNKNTQRPYTPSLKSDHIVFKDSYNDIKYCNAESMIIPSDNRQFNRHLCHIDSINKSISGLLSFVGRSDKESRKRQKIRQQLDSVNKLKNVREQKNNYHYISEKEEKIKQSDLQQGPSAFLISRPTSKYINEYSQGKSQEQVRPESPYVKIFEKSSRISSLDKKSSQSRSPVQNKSPISNSKQKISHIGDRSSRLQKSYSSHSSSDKLSSSRQSPKKFQYLADYQDHDNIIKQSSISQNQIKKQEIYQQKQKQIHKKSMYTVRQESSQAFQSYKSDKPLLQVNLNTNTLNSHLSLKSSKKQFKYLESNQEDQRFFTHQQNKQISNQLPKIAQNNRKFEIRLYPCDLNRTNIKTYIADRLLMMLIIDLQVEKQKNMIIAIAFSQYRKIHQSISKKTIFQQQIPILQLLKKQIKQKGAISLSQSIIQDIFAHDQSSQPQKYSVNNINHNQLVESFAHNIILAQKYWNNRMKQIITFNELDSTRFDPQQIDLESRGYLKVQDFTCLINLNASKISQLLNFSQFKEFAPIEYPKIDSLMNCDESNKKLFKNKETNFIFQRFLKRMKIYYINNNYDNKNSRQIVSNEGISYECFMDKLL